MGIFSEKEVLIESGNYRVVCIQHKYYSCVCLQRKVWFIWSTISSGLQIGERVSKIDAANALMTFAYDDNAIHKAMKLLSKR